MAQTTKRIDAVLEAARVKWGKLHCRTLTAVANTANALAGDYIVLNFFSPNLVETRGYVWFDDGPAVDPAPTGLTLIGSVSVTSGQAAASVATAIKTLLDAYTVSGYKPLKVTHQAGAVLTIELGATSEGIELAMEAQTVDITSNQTGGIIASQIYTGSSASLSMSLLEVSKDRFDVLVGQVTGDSVTPVSGTSVVGYGESRLFQSLDSLGGQLILHPIRLPETDFSNDVIFWKSAPKPQTLNFDGTAPQTLAVEFTAYLDLSKNPKINLFAKGDWTQDLDA